MKMIHKSASFSPNRIWRYSLHRVWDRSLPRCVFIGLNPSTADEEHDDNTVRRCIDYAASFGCGSLVMLNLFAYRATDPADMLAFFNPVGRTNNRTILQECLHSQLTIAAWGVHGEYRDRGKAVLTLLHDHGIDVHALHVTKDGHPGHPLYLNKDLRPVLFQPGRASA